MEITLSSRIELAKKETAEAARCKDWRLTRKRDRLAREEARKLHENGDGYIIATPAQMAKRYPDLINLTPRAKTEYHTKMVWGFYVHPSFSNKKRFDVYLTAF